MHEPCVRNCGVVFYIWISHQNPKFVAIDKEADDDVMYFLQLGETNRLAGQPFDPRPQGQMFPFDPLGVGFTGHMLGRRSMSFVSPPTIGIEGGDTQRLEKLF